MLYLIKSGDFLKIGYCKDLEKRLKQYSTHNPDYIVLETRNETSSDEYFLHKIFEKYRIDNTEWMKFNDEIINTFKTIHLNHRPSIKNSNSKKRRKHVKEIIKRRKVLKEANTRFLNSKRTTCF